MDSRSIPSRIPSEIKHFLPMRRVGYGGMLGLGPGGMDRNRPDHTGAHDGSNRMTTSRIDRSLSRRTALAGLGAGAVTLATARRSSAQDPVGELASHPIVGTWNAMTPGGPVLADFSADGTAII